jgi:hypothetical protein
MVYAEIIYLGKNRDGKDKLDFELHNSSTEMVEKYLEMKKEWMEGELHKGHFDNDEKYYLVSRALPLYFLAKHNFVPITKDFFFLKD